MILPLYVVALLFLPLALSSQPSAPDPIPAPLRDLKWGQLNFLHTTDTHSFFSGHLQEYADAVYKPALCLTD